MERVVSRDGTSIAYTREGAGPAVVLVGGNLDDGAENGPLAVALASGFTACTVVRRGRGASGDTAPYAVGREIEDLAAVLATVGRPAFLVGVSSGGALALEAVAAGLPVDGLAVYEVPYATTDEAARRFTAYRTDLADALAAGRRAAAVELFMRLAGAPEEDIDGARAAPVWPALEALAPTLAYDAACLGDGRPPVDRLAAVRCPTLVATGGVADPHTGGLAPGYFDDAADAVAAAAPTAERLVVEGQTHVPDPVVMADVLARFFRGPTGVAGAG